jgi:hypothetical protein
MSQRWPVAQATPQPPQFMRLVWVLTQAPPQAFSPMGQEHIPMTQLWPAEHTVPQVPQFIPSDVTSTQAIMAPVPQTARGAAQGTAQRPAVQVWPVGQALPQAPQLARSLWRSRQVPAQAVWPG